MLIQGATENTAVVQVPRNAKRTVLLRNSSWDCPACSGLANLLQVGAGRRASDSGSRFCSEWSADSVGRIWRSTGVRTFFEDREGWPQITHLRSCSGAEALTPKDGLFLFGPVDSNQNSARMDVGVIATAAGLQKYSKWVASIERFIDVSLPNPKRKRKRCQHVCGPASRRWPQSPRHS